ncbi:hypothetical protein D7X87_03845 [bacterium D16-54]|nr:hypothetical protein D7X87_03845 [bacterium D16-54]RKJ16291.1 hypothetical protein D7X65_03840 [bacterium D16-56]
MKKGKKAVRKGTLRSEEDTRDDGMRKKARLLQMVLWVGVILIQMTVVGNMEVYAQEQNGAVSEGQGDRIVVLSEVYQSKEDCPEPGNVHVAEDGAEYPLLSWEIECIQVPAQRRMVKTEGVCGPMEGISLIPESIMVTAWEGKQKAEVSCYLKEKTSVREEWQEDFSFPVTFHRYDAGVYRLGDRMIYGNEEKPQLDGCEELLLEEIGVSPKEYQVTEVRWDGEPYEDEAGELCRDAAAFGKKLVRDYRLVYEGMAEFPAYEAWRTSAVYKAGEEERIEEETEETREEDAAAQIEDTPSAAAAFPALARLWERITQTLLLTVGIGAVLFFAGLMILAALWMIRGFWPYGRKGKKQ